MSTIVQISHRDDERLERERRRRAERRAERREAENRARREQAAEDTEGTQTSGTAVGRMQLRWLDLALVVRLALAFGYRLADSSSRSFAPGIAPEEGYAVLEHSRHPAIAIHQTEDGTTELVSADMDMETHFVAPVAREYMRTKAVASLQGRGYTVQERTGPDGSLHLVATSITNPSEEVYGDVSVEGELQAHLVGVKGPRCMEIASDLSRAVDGRIVGSELTEEHYEVEVHNDQTLSAGHV